MLAWDIVSGRRYRYFSAPKIVQVGFKRWGKSCQQLGEQKSSAESRCRAPWWRFDTFIAVHFREQFCSLYSYSWQNRPTSNLGGYRPIIQSLAFPMWVSDLRYVALFRNYSASNAKFRPNFAFFCHPVKIAERWAKCLSVKEDSLQVDVLHFRYCAISKRELFEGGKYRPNFTVFDSPLKFRRVMDKLPEWMFTSSL